MQDTSTPDRANHHLLQSAVHGVLNDFSSAQITVNRAVHLIETARRYFLDSSFAKPDDDETDALEAIIYSSAVLLRNLHAEMESVDRKHREAAA